MTPALARVAVTTAADRAPTLAAALGAAGLEPVLLPCIEIDPAPDATLEAARRECAAADLIVLASQRPLQLLWPAGGMPDVPCAVVGPVTADAVRARGGTVRTTGSGTAAALVAELAGSIADAAVAFPHAAATDGAVVDSLVAAAGSLTEHAVYSTQPVAPGPDSVAAAAFVAPSTVAGWLLGRSLDGIVTAAIGETTATALRSRGVTPEVVAPTPAYVSLATTLASYLKEAA